MIYRYNKIIKAVILKIAVFRKGRILRDTLTVECLYTRLHGVHIYIICIYECLYTKLHDVHTHMYVYIYMPIYQTTRCDLIYRCLYTKLHDVH